VKNDSRRWSTTTEQEGIDKSRWIALQIGGLTFLVCGFLGLFWPPFQNAPGFSFFAWGVGFVLPAPFVCMGVGGIFLYLAGKNVRYWKFEGVEVTQIAVQDFTDTDQAKSVESFEMREIDYDPKTLHVLPIPAPHVVATSRSLQQRIARNGYLSRRERELARRIA
jgi:hypothetical protein